ncbi:MaoC/PaaZ C-terminal domain-containing protein [Nocardia sp. NBC_00881]|uniref:MaoC/PaaZ C-terminal domain-containing protein n=1 Tax=Nocardia sp. NBC_00881 TaxID=2975995 RepID=UPI00386B3EEE|nr:MaoC/PaaZ C-terminal domain-containing protein [Nocardia sp. NBC_00881]
MDDNQHSADFYQVEPETIREFARAVQNGHPAHWDDAAAHSLGYPGLIASATFASSIGAISQGLLFRTATTNHAPSQLLHLEQEIRIHRPVIAGDQLTCRVAVDSHRRTENGDLVVLTTVIADGDATPVQTVHTTLFGRCGMIADRVLEATRNIAAQALQSFAPHDAAGVWSAAVPGRALSGNRPASPRTLDIGTEIPPRVYRLSRTELIDYARVSGDHNPIHWNDEVAHAAGLNDVVAHGMLTMGLGADYLTAYLDDPACIGEYTVQFSRPVFVPATGRTAVHFTGAIQRVDHRNGTAVVALTAHSNGETVFGRATATVRLARPTSAQ